MTTTLVRQAARSVRPDLRVEPADIEFHNTAPDEVLIEVTVRNCGTGRSEPREARIEAAPLGAFVPWRPVTKLTVPALDPDEEVTLKTRARSLPADPLRLLDRGSVHWAGNLNVFVGGRPTERHMARALRVHPGALNLAMFVVGSGRDAYSFSLAGEVTDWDAALHHGSPVDLLLRRETPNSPVQLGTWIDVRSTTFMMLAMRVPAECRAGALDVHVVQKSTGREAVVEFSLDPKADGPGCYVVS